MTRIAFIGLGNMGAPMVVNLIKAGHDVTGHDINHAVVQKMAADGVKMGRSATETARGAEVVITMLPTGQEVRDVWLHQGGLMEAVKGGSPLLIDCSTIDVETARTVSESARRTGLAMLDAPVSGGVGGAVSASLTFMVGGTEEAFSRALPILQAMGRNIIHAGGPGAGQAAKICNNMMLSINMVGVSEAFLLAQRLGLDWNKLFEIATTSSGQSWALSTYCPAPGPVPAAPSNRDYAPGFTAALMLKDVKLAQAAAEATGSPTPLARLAMSFYQAVADAGEGSKDFSVVFRWLAGQKRKPD